MITNPTPLTAEDVVKFAQESRYETKFAENLKYVIEGFAEAYAAQQNAKLVAENTKLKASFKDYVDYPAHSEIVVPILAKLRNLQTENERLKQQPDLSRILKLAVVALEAKELLKLGMPGNAKEFLRIAVEALTPEDHQLLEAVLKE